MFPTSQAPLPRWDGCAEPTDHDKREWARMAQSAYGSNRNDVGHRFSCAASVPRGLRMRLAHYDALMHAYRAWLCFGEWPSQTT